MGKNKKKIPSFEEMLAENETMRELHEAIQRRAVLNAKLDATEARRAARWAWLRRLVRAA